ncbi:MAG: tRNA dihydrouridine synthase [Sarcina sp.]
MKYYLAPLEGITGYIYRNAYNKVFGNIDKYFAPFIVPNQSKKFKTKEINDILPENNEGIVLVPQILTNNAEHFIHTTQKVKELGYNEINLNLGCPSGTVVAKGKGSGFLAQKEELDKFLDEIFKVQDIKISIKTRLGKDEPQEFYEIMDIYNKYPLSELIIHARTQKDFYRNTPNKEMFKYGFENSKANVCYNGDIFTKEDNEKIISEFENLDNIMLARGIISNPGLIGEIKTDSIMTKDMVRDFHDEILTGYMNLFNNDQRLVLFKMKELWAYMSWMFTQRKKYAKNIRKSQTIIEYKIAVANLLSEQEIIKGGGLFKE